MNHFFIYHRYTFPITLYYKNAPINERHSAHSNDKNSVILYLNSNNQALYKIPFN